MRIVVFGGGMQGRVIAENLAGRKEKPDVIIADLKHPGNLPVAVTFMQCDVLDLQNVEAIVKGADSVVLAVPSTISHEALRNLIQTGVAVVDVSFTPDPPLSLNMAAKKTGSCCVVDCGVAPGLSHILVGAAYANMGGLDSVRILVGGMPQIPPKGFKHAVYFNAHDLISEYIRPARARLNGVDIQPEPMNVEFEPFHDGTLGQLELFLSDGLRSLLTSFPNISDMQELTIRHPGHLQSMKLLDELGCFKDQGATKALGNMFASTYPGASFADVLLMVIEVSKGSDKRSWRLIDYKQGDQSAMSRTTGYTTAAVAMVLARKEFVAPGVHAPEHLGKNPDIAQRIVKDLHEHGITVDDTSPVKTIT